MNITRIWKVFFSPTGNTDKAVTYLAEGLASSLNCPLEGYDFTLPASREVLPTFTASDLVVFGTPVYAGKVPNKLLPFVQSAFQGNGASVIPVVTFGNRSFDNGLAELHDCLENSGFVTMGAAAVASQHAFSDTLAAGRPDEEDKAQLLTLTEQICQKIKNAISYKVEITDGETSPQLSIPGDAAAPYYKPLGLDGNPAVFLKAKPQTDIAKCTNCGICAESCPMGSINSENPSEVTGICIKCHACVNKCPEKAKYFDDPAFLSHKAMLEKNFQRRAGTVIFY